MARKEEASYRNDISIKSCVMRTMEDQHNGSYIGAFKAQQDAMDEARLLAKEAQDKGRKSQVLVQGKGSAVSDGMELRRGSKGRQRIGRIAPLA